MTLWIRWTCNCSVDTISMAFISIGMCVRLFPIFTPNALIVIAYIGAITAILAALIAVSQNDIKKVLASPTVVKLGFII